jgi:hypothetical protein
VQDPASGVRFIAAAATEQGAPRHSACDDGGCSSRVLGESEKEKGRVHPKCAPSSTAAFHGNCTKTRSTHAFMSSTLEEVVGGKLTMSKSLEEGRREKWWTRRVEKNHKDK